MKDAIHGPPGTRAGFDALALYDEPTECSADLSDNTNLWGMPPAAEAALMRVSAASARGYPSTYTPALKKALGAYADVDPSMVVTGCGSDDVLDAAIRAYGNPGSRLAFCEPTFSMIPVLARINGLTPVFLQFDDSWDLPVDELLSSGSEIIYICSPNNPTATPASLERIEAIAKSSRGLVIVDAAYEEYSAASLTPLAARYSNLLVTRTMSKVFGMAGLRVGYGIGTRALVREIEKSRGPYKVSSVAEAVSLAALSEDLPWVSQVVADTLANRTRLVSALAALGCATLPSDANFVLVPVSNSAAVARSLLSQGIAVRVLGGLPRIGDAIRVTIGPWPMMQSFLDAFMRSTA